MKIPALLTLLVTALLVALPTRRANAQEASFDLFYNSLADDGDWYNTPDFGYVWHPTVADGNDKWRPYTDGYWAQTDDGWAWVSYEPFGWATYHYGRWTRLQSIGWAWVPGYQWGPGWVSWRTSDEYVGWAPLPPRAEPAGSIVSVDYNSVEAVDDGYTAAVDTDYDIGPDNYCFVGVRQFGAPVLSEVLLPRERNFLFVGSTVNVTNIYYRRGPDRTVVYNSGPDFGFISAHVDRPIQRLRIDRREDLAYLRDNGHGANPTVVKNGVLLVAAPVIARRAVNFEQVRPVRVKSVIAQPEIVHGWSNAGGSPAQVQLLRERVKTQSQAAPRQARADLPPRTNAPAVEPQVRERTTVDQPARERTTVNPPGQGQAEADRLARRDAAQREKEARDQARSNGDNPPGRTVTAPANGENSPNRVQPQTLQERLARKQAQQAAQGREQAAASADQTDAANARAERQEARSTPRANQPAPNADQAERDARRAERQQQGQPAQPRTNQVPPNGDQSERDARRTERPEQNQSAQQAQQAQQAQERAAARRSDRQTAPSQPQAAPQPGNGDDKKEKKNN